MKKLMLVLIMFLILVASASARYYDIALSEDAGKLRSERVYVMGGDRDIIYVGNDYTLTLLSYDDEELTTFNFDLVGRTVLQFPYYNNGRTIVISNMAGREVLEIDVAKFATLCPDQICEDHENYATCPEDCPSGVRDNYCDKESDGRCDPDCDTGDFDCEAKNRTTLFLVLGGIIALLVLGITAYIVYDELIRKEALQRVQKQGNKLAKEVGLSVNLELQEWVEKHRKKGFSNRQMKKKLLRTGWPEHEVKEALK